MSASPRLFRRSGTPRPPKAQRQPGSRNVRRLYPPLILILVIVVIVGLVNKGGSSSHKPPAKSAGSTRSVFPAPSTVPTAAPPPVVAPTQTVASPPAATQGKPCQPVQVNGQTVNVSILQGQVICRNARAVVLAFKSGKGTPGGSPGSQYMTVRGWKCVPSGTCTRPGKSIKAS